MKITAKTIKYAILPTLIVLLVGGIIDAYLCQYIIKDQSIILWLCIGSAFVFFIILWCCFVEYKNQVKWQKIDTIVNGIVQAIKCLIVPMLVVLAIAGGIDAYMYQCIIGKDKPISSVELMSGCVALASLWLFFRRVKNQDTQLEQQNEQIDIQINKEIDDRFHAAVQLLASNETSARTGGIYSLYQLAIEPKGEKYRVQVAQILCSHIRSKTQELEYQKQHRERPSNEIQTAIDILFKYINGIKGIYQQDFSKYYNFPRANLSHAYLQGADFNRTQCQGANFSEAQCQGANFYKADCQEANFIEAQCQKSNFSEAQCQETDFTKAQCQGVYFMHAQCQRACFHQAYCRGADFSVAQCQGAYFYKAYCQGAGFSEAQCQGANFREARCQGTNFRGVQCQGAIFVLTKCQGIDFTIAQFQGVQFHHTEFQGAYTEVDDNATPASDRLKKRIEEETELKEEVQFEGPLDELVIKPIEKVKQYLSADWYKEMEAIIKEHANKEVSYAMPEGIITGVLEDSDELQAIIKELEAIEKLHEQRMKAL